MNHLSPSDSPGLQLQLLGNFECRWNGQPLTGLSYDKMCALLAYLAMESQPCRRELLADLLWSGSDPTIARGNLRRTLSDLRRVLEKPARPQLFLVGNGTIQIVAGVEVDALSFLGPHTSQPQRERASTANDEADIALYRGEFMAGFHLPNCPDFEDWLVVQREALHRHALVLLERLASAHESNGESGKALRFALHHVELAPWDETAHRRVMRLQASAGLRGAALRQFELCAALLKKELGLTPGVQTCELAERIRAAEFAHETADTSPMVPRAAALPAVSERRLVTVLFCELTAPGTADPEDASEMLEAPRERCVDILRRHAALVVPMPGGGLLAYFGLARSHEDSPVRAVRAALEVARAATRDIAIRTGAHTGLITTGRDPALPDIVGQTSAIAVQMHRCVDTAQTAISQSTHRLVAGYFDCTSLGVPSRPGWPGSMPAFRVEREYGARTLMAARSGRSRPTACGQ